MLDYFTYFTPCNPNNNHAAEHAAVKCDKNVGSVGVLSAFITDRHRAVLLTTHLVSLWGEHSVLARPHTALT